MHDPDVAQFDRAFSSVTVPPAPLAAIQRTAKSRAAQRARRNAVICVAFCVILLSGAIPFKGVPAAAAVVAYVQEVLRPADPARMIVLRAAGARVPADDYHRVSTIRDAQAALPFHVVVPPVSAHWTLATVMVSTGANPAIALLYGSSHGVWVRITERPANAHTSAADADVAALIERPAAAKQTMSGVLISRSPAVQVVQRTQVADNVRAVVSATGPRAKIAVLTPLH